MKHILIFALALPAFAQLAPPDRMAAAFEERSLSQQAMRLKTDDRIAMYQSLIKAKPEQVRYYNLLGGAYIQKVRETTDFSYLDRAAQILDQVLSMDSGNYEALRLRSEVELEKHNFSKVVEYSKQLVRQSPDDPWNWGTLADALVELGRYDEAAEAIQKMVNLRPDLSSYNRAAYFRFLSGDMNGAIDIMRKAVQAGSSSPENIAWCMVELGGLYWKSGALDDARKTYEAALVVFPNYHPAHAGLGRVLAAQGNSSAAIGYYRKAQAVTPLPDYAAALYDLYTASGNPAEAAKQMQLIDLTDKLGQAANEKTNRNLALIYADHDRKLDRALELAKAEFAVRKDVYTWDTYAWALYKNGKIAEADQAMAEALKLGTPDPLFRKHAALIASAKEKQK